MFFFLTGGKVSGYNIDPNQIQNAKDYAVETNFQDRLDFKVGNHHDPLEYADATFDGCYSFQAIWPFFKPNELLAYTKEMYRVLKPGNLFIPFSLFHRLFSTDFFHRQRLLFSPLTKLFIIVLFFLKKYNRCHLQLF